MNVLDHCGARFTSPLRTLCMAFLRVFLVQLKDGIQADPASGNRKCTPLYQVRVFMCEWERAYVKCILISMMARRQQAFELFHLNRFVFLLTLYGRSLLMTRIARVTGSMRPGYLTGCSGSVVPTRQEKPLVILRLFASGKIPFSSMAVYRDWRTAEYVPSAPTKMSPRWVWLSAVWIVTPSLFSEIDTTFCEKVIFSEGTCLSSKS